MWWRRKHTLYRGRDRRNSRQWTPGRR
jgi:hypothetical protein